MKATVTYETELTWFQTRANVWKVMAGERHVGVIHTHPQGSLCLTWYTDQNCEYDTSITGDFAFLIERAQKKWDDELKRLGAVVEEASNEL